MQATAEVLSGCSSSGKLRASHPSVFSSGCGPAVTSASELTSSGMLLRSDQDTPSLTSLRAKPNEDDVLLNAR